MSLGDARIDISANLAPLRKGIAKARSEVTSFVTATKRKIATPRSLMEFDSSKRKPIDIEANVKPLLDSMKEATSAVSSMVDTAKSKLKSLRSTAPMPPLLRGLDDSKQKPIEIRANVKPLINGMKKAASAVSNMVGTAKSKFMSLRSAVRARAVEMEKEFSAKIKRMTDNVKKSTLTIIASFTSIKAFALSASRAIPAIGRAAIKTAKVIKTVLSPALNVVTAGLRKMIGVAKLAALSLIGIGIASVKIASDTIEAENLFVVSMGKMSDSANAWTKSYSKSLNLFNTDTKKSLGTFQLILTSMGLTEKEAFKMSKGLVRLTNDISSFRNLKPEDVFLKLQGGITGEIRPLRNIGILINETTIKQLALNDATIMARVASEKSRTELKKIGNLYVDVKKKTKDGSIVLTEQEKIMLRYKAIVSATGKDLNDMKRTMDDAANVFRVIGAQVRLSGDTIGKVFIPQVTKAAIVVRNWLIDNQERIKGWATNVSESITAVVNKLQQYFDLAKQGNFEAIFTDLGRIFSKMLEGINAAFQRMRPVAVELGTAIADGFIAAISKTKLGEFLGDSGNYLKEGTKNTAELGRRLTFVDAVDKAGRKAAEAFGPKLEPVRSRFQGDRRFPIPPEQTNRLGDPISEKILMELRLQTKMLTGRGI